MEDSGEDRVDWICLDEKLLLRATELFAEEGRKLLGGLLIEEGRCGLLCEKNAVGGGERVRQQTEIRFKGVKEKMREMGM